MTAVGYILGISYPLLALSTGARGIYQIIFRDDLPKLGPALTIFSSLLYLIASVGFFKRSRRAWRVSVTALSLISFVPLLVLGEPAILSENAMSVLGESMAEGTDALLTQTYTLVWIIPAAIIAVGYGLRRDFRATLERLGLVLSLIHISEPTRPY